MVENDEMIVMLKRNEKMLVLTKHHEKMAVFLNELSDEHIHKQDYDFLLLIKYVFQMDSLYFHLNNYNH